LKFNLFSTVAWRRQPSRHSDQFLVGLKIRKPPQSLVDPAVDQRRHFQDRLKVLWRICLAARSSPEVARAATAAARLNGGDGGVGIEFRRWRKLHQFRLVSGGNGRTGGVSAGTETAGNNGAGVDALNAKGDRVTMSQAVVKSLLQFVSASAGSRWRGRFIGTH
jgi:hypothetical protein